MPNIQFLRYNLYFTHASSIRSEALVLLSLAGNKLAY